MSDAPNVAPSRLYPETAEHPAPWEVRKTYHCDECAANDQNFSWKIFDANGNKVRAEYMTEAVAARIVAAINGCVVPAQGWPASLPPEREVRKLIDDFIAPDLDTEKAFATHRRSWIVQCLQALLTAYAVSSTNGATP